ncbi:HIT family protein [Thiobacter aerophilum]|uniref:HIT family protein n=1 Tax=Thiobacter aerophilum TaxID=3121275 RepID=A0ABV0EK02_9BURK
MTCPFCAGAGGELVWQDAWARVVLAQEAGYPGFCRVIWQAHVKEMSDLAADERRHLMDVVFAVETVLRRLIKPAKINLASLGNQVPHLHWHVIPRFLDDPHYPMAVWAPPLRPAPVRLPPAPRALRQALEDILQSS